MATVCITFFLITQLYVCKMEADLEDRLKKISRREKRWSMNSQRLEEIVAELMKPISDVRRNFDTDLSALLEEYLTEAGLRALEAGEDDSLDSEPNFAEIALLLQHSANIYSRKVDFLYQDVLRVTDSLNNTIIEAGEAGEGSAEAGEGGAGGAAALRAAGAVGRRGAAGGGGFSPLQLERSAAASREPAPRPPPTLPRMYIELEPRQLAAADAQLLDQAGEPIGLLADFHVAWRLQDGFLVEELEQRARGEGGGRQRAPGSPLPLTPPPLTLPQLDLPPPPPSPFLPPSPFNCSTPLPKPIKKERKRRIDVDLDIDSTAKLLICEGVLSELRRGERREFSVPERWIQRVVQRRSGQVLSGRLLLRRRRETEFLGWDTASARDVGGFLGWEAAEARSELHAALTALTALTELRRVRLRADDSDDDGFFEQSSYSDGEPRHSPDSASAPAAPAAAHSAHTSSLAEQPEWFSWRERVLSRSTEAAPDVRRTAAQLLRALAPAAPGTAAPGTAAPGTAAPTAPAAPITALLRRQHRAHGTSPAHLTLAALFLANSGNVEIVPGAPLTVNSFSVRLLTADAALYRPAMARDQLS